MVKCCGDCQPVSRNGHSARSSTATPSCFRSHSFSSQAACHNTRHQPIPPSYVSLPPSPFSISSSISGLRSSKHPGMGVRSKRQHRSLADVSETVREPGNRWRGCLRPTSSHSAITFGWGLFLYRIASTMSHGIHPLSRIMSSIHSTTTKFGHETIVLLLQGLYPSDLQGTTAFD